MEIGIGQRLVERGRDPVTVRLFEHPGVAEDVGQVADERRNQVQVVLQDERRASEVAEQTGVVAPLARPLEDPLDHIDEVARKVLLRDVARGASV